MHVGVGTSPEMASVRESTACVRCYTLSLLLAIQLDICLAGLLPKGDTLPTGRCSRRLVATLLWCKPRQSKRPPSIHFVQSRNCDNLLSSLFIGLIVRSRHFQPFLISEHRPFFTTAISIIIGFFDFFSKHTLLSITFCFPLTLRQI